MSRRRSSKCTCSRSDAVVLKQPFWQPDRLFRGTQCSTGLKVVIKAVHVDSREHHIIRYLSCPTLRNHPFNHCIRECVDRSGHELAFTCFPLPAVLALIECPEDRMVFIVMEEWSSQLTTSTPCNLGRFFSALRQCIEVSGPANTVPPPWAPLSESPWAAPLIGLSRAPSPPRPF